MNLTWPRDGSASAVPFDGFLLASVLLTLLVGVGLAFALDHVSAGKPRPYSGAQEQRRGRGLLPPVGACLSGS